MKYKNLLLVVFFLTLFVFQQVQAGENMPSEEKLSEINAPLANTVLHNVISVYIYPLNPAGFKLSDNPCNKWDGTVHGCGGPEPVFSGTVYQDFTVDCNVPPSNPYPRKDTDQNGNVFYYLCAEQDYLPNVLPNEMDLADIRPPEPEALKAQAVASRTVASYKTHFAVGGRIDNSVFSQVYIPGSKSLSYPDGNYQFQIDTAVTETAGQFLQHPNYTPPYIDAEFSSDMGSSTITYKDAEGNESLSYLIGVQDPISNTTCQAGVAGNGYGMSQRGAIRWARGNQCPSATGGDILWPIKWDYQQILAHYYTGVDFMNDNTGAKVAPDDRWNLLYYDGIPSTLSPGQQITANIWLQNTSTQLWSEGEAILGYQWVGTDGTGTWVSDWNADKTLPLTAAGGDQKISLTVTAPADGKSYNMLRLDVKRGVSGAWFSSAGWLDAKIEGITVTGGSTPTPTPTATNTPTLIKTGRLYARSDAGGPYIETISNLTPGMQYRIVISGFVLYYGPRLYVDAQWDDNGLFNQCYCKRWNVIKFNDVRLSAENGQTVYDPSHTYTFLWLANATELQMYTTDTNYADNSGYFTYQIFEDAFIGLPTPTLSTPSGLTSTALPPGFTPPAPTAIFTPTPTLIPPSTSTPAPCTCRWGDTCILSSQNGGVKLASLSQEFMFATNKFDRISDQAALLYRVRDELLSANAEGQRYTALYYEYSAEIASIMLGNPALDEQGLNVIDALMPNLQSLLDGQGNSTVVTVEQIQQAQAFLDALLPYASPALQQAISAERARRPLESMIGMTMNQSWNYLNGYQIEWHPPLNAKNPYSAQQGRVIPIEFTLTDMNGNFVQDPSVTLRVVDASENVVVSSTGISDNPAQGIVIQGDPQGAAPKYHYNLDTSGLPKGDYTLQVLYNSTNPQEPSSWQITIIGKK